MIITENDIKNMVIKSLNKIGLFENVNIQPDKIYTTITGIIDEKLSDILSYGLRCNDNGETNGIWFSLGHLFYGQMPNAFIFSLPYNNEIRDLFGFDKFDWENKSSILVAHKDIPIKYLTIEQGFYGKVYYNNEFRGTLKWEDISYEEARGYMKDFTYIIYEDLYEILYKHSIPDRDLISTLPNFKIENYLLK